MPSKDPKTYLVDLVIADFFSGGCKDHNYTIRVLQCITGREWTYRDNDFFIGGIIDEEN